MQSWQKYNYTLVPKVSLSTPRTRDRKISLPFHLRAGRDPGTRCINCGGEYSELYRRILSNLLTAFIIKLILTKYYISQMPVGQELNSNLSLYDA